jgi:hypothetical protein
MPKESFAVPNKGLLGTVDRKMCLSRLGLGGSLPATQLLQDAFDFIGVGTLEVLAFLAEAFAPDFHDAHLLTAYSANGGRTAKLATAKVASTLVQIHPRPICREQTFQIFLHNALTVIGFHCFLLTDIGFCCNASFEVEFLTLTIADDGFSPDLVNRLQFPRVMLTFAGYIDRPESAVARDISQEAGV